MGAANTSLKPFNEYGSEYLWAYSLESNERTDYPGFVLTLRAVEVTDIPRMIADDVIHANKPDTKQESRNYAQNRITYWCGVLNHQRATRVNVYTNGPYSLPIVRIEYRVHTYDGKPAYYGPFVSLGGNDKVSAYTYGAAILESLAKLTNKADAATYGVEYALTNLDDVVTGLDKAKLPRIRDLEPPSHYGVDYVSTTGFRTFTRAERAALPPTLREQNVVAMTG